MMFLKNESPSLIAELAKRLDPDSRPEEGLSPADIHITDFDGQSHWVCSEATTHR